MERLIQSLEEVSRGIERIADKNPGTDWAALVFAAVSAVATIIAAYAAWRSADAARKAAEETELARKSDFLPILSLEVEARSETTVRITVKNIGRDLARTVGVLYPQTSQAVLRMDTLGSIGKSGEKSTEWQIGGIEPILALPKGKRKLQVLYTDLFGRRIITEAALIREVDDSTNERYNHVAIAAWKLRLPEDLSLKRVRQRRR